MTASSVLGATGPVPTYRVLMVCTGNTCRSPVMERLLRARLSGLRGGDSVLVTSAGTAAPVGGRMASQSARLLVSCGADPDGFTARQLDEGTLADVDLVLTADRGHRSVVVAAAPELARRTFTLREYARLAGTVAPGGVAGADSASRLRDLTRRVGAGERFHRVADPTVDDIPDPIGRSDDCYDDVGRLIVAALDIIVDRVDPPA